MIGAGCAPRPISACLRPIGSKRSARWRRWSTKIASARPRRPLRLARAARQGRDAVAARQSRPLARAPRKAASRRGTHPPVAGAAVGPYAEADAVAALALFEDLNPILDREGTRAAYRLDVDLLPMVHEMRRRGIRIDQSAAERARDYCLQKRDAALRRAIGAARQRRQHEEIGRRRDGKRKPSTPIASLIRAPKRAIRRSRPARPDGWSPIHTGCRS